MTSTGTDIHCPVCNSSDIERINQASQRCLNCNVVTTGDDRPVDVGKTPVTENNNSDGGEEYRQQWQDVVTVQDSSDETLVRLIGDSEGYIRELYGTTEDCIKAAETVCEAWENQYFRGRSIVAGIAAVVYTTFREQGSPRPLNIVSYTCDVSVQDLRTAYQSLRDDCNRHTTITPAATYLPFLRTQLGLDKVAEERAIRLIESTDVTGSPASIASACLYLATKEQEESITLAEAGAASGVAKETVWKKTQELTS